MRNASSTFLRGANTGGKATDVPPDDGTMLGAVAAMPGTTVANLAAALGVILPAVEPTVTRMKMSGLLVENAAGELNLTKTGERALRYSSVAKF